MSSELADIPQIYETNHLNVPNITHRQNVYGSKKQLKTTVMVIKGAFPKFTQGHY